MTEFLSDESKAKMWEHTTEEAYDFGIHGLASATRKDILALLYELEVTKKAYSLALDDLSGFHATRDRALLAKGFYMEQARHEVDQEHQS